MPRALNQRWFDAPLAGCLVLGEQQPELEEHLGDLAQGLSWQLVDEATECITRWLRDETSRARRVEAMARRIRDGHLFVHRMKQILVTLNEAG